MKYNFYSIHLYINVNGRRYYVSTVNGDRIKFSDGNVHHDDWWHLYAGDTLVTCGDVKGLHADVRSSDLDYNSYVFSYTENR